MLNKTIVVSTKLSDSSFPLPPVVFNPATKERAVVNYLKVLLNNEDTKEFSVFVEDEEDDNEQ